MICTTAKNTVPPNLSRNRFHHPKARSTGISTLKPSLPRAGLSASLSLTIVHVVTPPSHAQPPVISAAKPSQAIHHVTSLTPLVSSTLNAVPLHFVSVFNDLLVTCSSTISLHSIDFYFDRPRRSDNLNLPQRRLPYSHHGRGSAPTLSSSLSKHIQTPSSGLVRLLWSSFLYYEMDSRSVPEHHGDE